MAYDPPCGNGFNTPSLLTSGDEEGGVAGVDIEVGGCIGDLMGGSEGEVLLVLFFVEEASIEEDCCWCVVGLTVSTSKTCP